MQLFAEPSHCAIGVMMVRISSVWGSAESKLMVRQNFQRLLHFEVFFRRKRSYQTLLWQTQCTEEATRGQTESPQGRAFSQL